jgi:hypothetical protein
MAQTVPDQDAGQSVILQPLYANPYSPAWWSAQVITDIPAESIGWLVAQGWQITQVDYDTTTNPPTASFTLARESLQNTQILGALLQSYTDVNNLALLNNTTRYNDVVASWTEMFDNSNDYFATQTAEWDTHQILFLANLDTFMNEVDGLIDANQSTLALDAAVSTDALTDLNTTLPDLETNVSDTTTTIDTLLTTQDGYLATFLVDFSAKLGELDTNYTAHLSTINTLLTTADTDLTAFEVEQPLRLAELESEYAGYVVEVEEILDDLETEFSLHATTSTAFLVDLGATELARINEQFDASLATQIQQLIDRGLYSSAVATDITARNTRDRNEEIVALNDRLNREKWEDEHRLYGQQVGVRDRKLTARNALYEGTNALKRFLVDEAARLNQVQQTITQWKTSQRDRLFEQLQQIDLQQLTGVDRKYTAQQDVSRTEMGERERLLGFLQDAVRGILTGKERYAGLTMQNASVLSDSRHRAIGEKMDEAARRLAGLQTKFDECLRLMQYQLDERNKILVGLYGFVERRDDVAPSFEALVQISAGLADAGGGWVTP